MKGETVMDNNNGWVIILFIGAILFGLVCIGLAFLVGCGDTQMPLTRSPEAQVAAAPSAPTTSPYIFVYPKEYEGSTSHYFYHYGLRRRLFFAYIEIESNLFYEKLALSPLNPKQKGIAFWQMREVDTQVREFTEIKHIRVNHTGRATFWVSADRCFISTSLMIAVQGKSVYGSLQIEIPEDTYIPQLPNVYVPETEPESTPVTPKRKRTPAKRTPVVVEPEPEVEEVVEEEVEVEEPDPPPSPKPKPIQKLTCSNQSCHVVKRDNGWHVITTFLDTGEVFDEGDWVLNETQYSNWIANLNTWQQQGD